MSGKRAIHWPYGYTDERNQNTPRFPYDVINVPPAQPRGELSSFVAALNDMDVPERREFLTWLREMTDHYGYDSATAIERGIEPE